MIRSVRATVAALGAYYLVTAIVLAALLPFQFSLPRFGSISYPELGVILGVATAFGSGVAAAVAVRFDGGRAALLLTLLWAIAAVAIIAPFVAEGTRAFVPPKDLTGVLPGTVITLSVLVGGPGLAVGALVGARMTRSAGSPAVILEAAGAYYVACVAISLPVPQLDVRLMLPFTATGLPTEWHVLAIGVPAIVAGVALSMRPLTPRRIAMIGALLGLAGALPAEVPVLIGLLAVRPYWPTSLVGVPLLSAIVAAGSAYGARLVAGMYRASRGGELRGRDGLAIGATGALLVLAALNVFAGTPGGSDHDASAEGFQRTGDERKLVVWVVSGRGEQILGSSARETGTTVYVSVRLRMPPSWYAHDLVGIPLPVVVTLRDPLGDRTVIDARTGQVAREVRRSAVPPSGSWC